MVAHVLIFGSLWLLISGLNFAMCASKKKAPPKQASEVHPAQVKSTDTAAAPIPTTEEAKVPPPVVVAKAPEPVAKPESVKKPVEAAKPPEVAKPPEPVAKPKSVKKPVEEKAKEKPKEDKKPISDASKPKSAEKNMKKAGDKPEGEDDTGDGYEAIPEMTPEQLAEIVNQTPPK